MDYTTRFIVALALMWIAGTMIQRLNAYLKK